MTLTAGDRLGPYEVTAQIGVGGMGEVYRATDTRLKRDVALKILPSSFAVEPGRLARFEREAEVLASLNHPNIAHLYGVEERGGVMALVMELVDATTLADRIAQGPIPLDEAMGIARQILDALDAAHERTIIHRDLKPANVSVRADGTVKVLDFGLAKAIEPQGAGGSGFSLSPTITSPAMTELGMILGTAAYMSPEQARGKPADRRADIWAFGCVLYEMLSGVRAFEDEDVSLTLSRVLQRDADFQRLPADLPPRVRMVVQRCLEKDVRRRIHAVGDVRLLLDGAFETAQPAISTVVAAPTGSRWRRLGLPAAGALALAAATGAAVWLATRSDPPRASRFLAAPQVGPGAVTPGPDGSLTMTRDGGRIVYVGNEGTQLFVTALDAVSPVPVFTGSPRGPFLSSDERSIGFTDVNLVMKRVEIEGGPGVPIATLDGQPRGAVWTPDNSIIVGTTSPVTGLQRIPVTGGSWETLTRPDEKQAERDHVFPQLLPGGRAVLFTITSLNGGLETSQVAVLNLDTGARKVLIPGATDARYVKTGHLVFAAGGALHAIAFDLAALETRGTAVRLVPDVNVTPFGALNAAVAGDGTLVYLAGAGERTQRRASLLWVDRGGRETVIPVEPRPFALPRLSPDGHRLALYAGDQGRDLWILEMASNNLRPVWQERAADVFPLWTRSGDLVFSSERNGVRNLYSGASDGSGSLTRLTDSKNAQHATAVTPDDAHVLFTESSATTIDDVMSVEMAPPHRVTPLVNSKSSERNGAVSPNGRWLAYESNDSGRYEISVRAYPAMTDIHQVSTAGGITPLWTPDGKGLVYVSPDGGLMRVDVDAGAAWKPSQPYRAVREGYATTGRTATPGRNYDISRDGRYLMMKAVPEANAAAPATPSLIVVQHWFEQLEQLVPGR